MIDDINLWNEAADGLLMIDLEGNYVKANKAACEMLKYSESEILSFNIRDLVDVPQISTERLALLSSGKRAIFETNMICKDGTLTPFEIHAKKLSNGYILGIVRDITLRQKIRADLEDQEQKYLSLLINIPGMIYKADASWKAEYITSPMLFTGYTIDELNSMEYKWFSIILPEDQAMLIEDNDHRAFHRRSKSIIQTYRIRHKDGSIRWVEDHKTSHVVDGEFRGVDGIIFDITERVENEQRLKKSEVQMKKLFENMTDAFALHRVVVDEHDNPVDYVYLDINVAFTNFFGLGRDIIGQRVTEVVPGIENDTRNWIGKYGTVALTGKPLHIKEYSEILGRHYEISAYSPESGYFVTIFTDRTSEILAEEDRLRLQKIESLALLAGGIAHDFNNILVGILGNINLMQLNPNNTTDQILSLKEIEKAPCGQLISPDSS